MSVERVRRAFTTADYYRMAESGILGEDDRVELIEGEVIQMSPIGSRHAGCIARLITFITEQMGRSVIVNSQNPVHLDEYSEPQPDVIILKPREDFYSNSHPTPDDVLVVIEVADSSVVYDRAVKVPLYARAGIAEVWLVDLVRNVLEIYSAPEQTAYRDVRELRRGEQLSSGQVPGLILSVDEILG
ncbi:MAG TPA: Uma2 family endonuclease [Pyrinomonadaceae bacterium]|jgi:Uma2 family endonuclease